jgi:hypothetical protein
VTLKMSRSNPICIWDFAPLAVTWPEISLAESSLSLSLSCWQSLSEMHPLVGGMAKSEVHADSPDATGSRGMPKSEFFMCHSHASGGGKNWVIERQRNNAKCWKLIQVEAALKLKVRKNHDVLLHLFFFERHVLKV